MRTLSTILLIPLIAAGCAEPRDAGPETAAAASEGRDCFWPNAVTGFSDAGRDQVRIHAGGDEYLFEMFGSCPDLDFAEDIALRSRGPGMICRGIDAELIVPSSIGPRRCPVRMIRKVEE